MAKSEFDKQGKYFWYLAKCAGWTEERVNALIMKKYQATHFNALTGREKSAMVAIMKRYADKQSAVRLKRHRQAIMAMVAKAGHDLDWLHARMIDWGYGDSMRALAENQLRALYMDIKKTLNQ